MDGRHGVAARLAEGGSVDARAEADALVAAAEQGRDDLERLVERRLAGEPIAWIVGSTLFRGLRLEIDAGVFVPRAHTEILAGRAAARLPDAGIAVDLCTGCGAVAAVLVSERQGARVVATDLDAVAVACARRNGVDALVGDLDEPLPDALRGSVDVLTAVVPYVPTERLHLLPHDVLAHEPRRALDGGERGLGTILRVVELAPRWLRRGGVVLLELGGDQAGPVGEALAAHGFDDVRVLRDPEGDDRAIEGTLGDGASVSPRRR